MVKRQRRVSIADAILGIDLGSTSTRVCLWCPGRKDEIINVENTESGGKVPPGDFSSVGYPFELEGPVYLGGNADPSRRPISLKYGFYALAEPDKDDEMLKQYVMVTPLTLQKGNPAFRERLLQGLRELFLTLKERIDYMCKLYSLEIKTIGLSVPAQWTLHFERVYRELIVDVFKQSPDNVSIHTETEALAHTLLRNHQITLPECGDNMYDVYLFLDFGGHNMNGCIFNVVHGQEHDASFYRIGDPFGAGGGSEQWSYHVGEEFAKLFQFLRGRRMTSEEWKTFTDQFDSCKPNIGPSSSKEHVMFGGWDMTLKSVFINDSFELSHRHVLAKADDYISEVSKLRGVTPYIIVSGGTAKHKTVQDRLQTMCKKHGIINEPLFTNEWSITHGSGRIARGVAYAAGSRLNFNQFLQRGAAFGIQRKQNSTRGDGNPKGEWDSFAELLFSKDTQVPLEVNAGSGMDEFKIICDPFFEPGENPDKLQFDHCYDFLHLGILKKGRWKITFSVTGTQDLPSLVLKGSRFYAKKSKKRRIMAVKTFDVEHTTNPLPMSFDGGANCYFADEELFDGDHFCRGLPSRSPEDAKEANLARLQTPGNGGHQSGAGNSGSAILSGENASSPNGVEKRTRNNTATAQQHNIWPGASNTSLPTSKYQFALREDYPAPVALMSPIVSIAQPNELPRNQVDSPHSRIGHQIENRGGFPLPTTRRRPLDTAMNISKSLCDRKAGGLRSQPVRGPRMTENGIDEDTDSDSD